MSFVLKDTYNSVYGLTQIAVALYGFALYYFEKNARGGSFRSLPGLLTVVSFYIMGFFGLNSLVFVGNYFYDLRGGFLHLIFAKS